MKNVLKIVLAALIGILAGEFIFRSCFPNKDGGVSIQIDTVYQDSVVHVTVVGKPYPVVRDTGSIQYYPLVVDTAEIFAAYGALHGLFYTKNIYCDTLKNDSAAFIALHDTIFKNELQARSLVYQNRTPTYYITKTLREPEKSQWYVGADVTGLRGNVGADASILFINKGVAYRYAYSPLVGEHSLGIYVRLWPRSRSPASLN
jgi:hypothetical protein